MTDICKVNINKGKPHLEWSQEALKGEPSCVNFGQEKVHFATPAGGREIFSWPSNSPASEKLPQFGQ